MFGLSLRRVKNYRVEVYRTLGARNAAHAAYLALRRGPVILVEE